MNSIRPQVFLSYSHKDKEFVQKLCNDLVRAGVDCWIDSTAISAGDRLQEAVFRDGIPRCNLFVAYVTESYLASDWCGRELNQALLSPRVVVVPLADSEQTLEKIDATMRDTVHYGVINPELYWDRLLELSGKAWASLQNSRRLVPSENHLLAGAGIFDMEEYRRDALLRRVRRELILAAPNLRSWLSDQSMKRKLITLVRETEVTLTFIMATYETLRPISVEGAEHLRQSAEDVNEMIAALREDERARLNAYFHAGASTLSAVFIDPETPDGILFFSPRWAIQFLPDDRLTCVIDKSINSTTLFKAIYNSVILMTQRDAKSVTDMLSLN